jgi:hypothetical protein
VVGRTESLHRAGDRYRRSAPAPAATARSAATTARSAGLSPETWCNSEEAANESGHRVILASLE